MRWAIFTARFLHAMTRAAFDCILPMILTDNAIEPVRLLMVVHRHRPGGGKNDMLQASLDALRL